MAQEKIKDFGNKIGGARKDIWGSRGLYVKDLDEMNESEILKHVKKANIWIKPDYQKLVNEGLPREVAYFYKCILDSLPTAPSISSLASDEEIEREAKRYIEAIKAVQEKTMSIKTIEECKTMYSWVSEEFLKNSFSVKDEWINIDIRKLNKAAFGFRSDLNIGYRIREMNKKEFCMNENDKFSKAYKERFEVFETDTITFKKRENREGYNMIMGTGWATSIISISSEVYEVLKDKKYVIYDTKKGVYGSDKSETELRKELEERLRNDISIDKKEGSNKKTKYKYSPLADIKRVGEEYRERNAEGNDFIKDFNFYGGEFGNWLNEDDRQKNLNFAYDSFKDLGKALGFTDKEITLDGKLAIAFGARGRSAALAHYEPERRVINLTKMHGAGSLAHEYGHFLDNVLSGMIDENKGRDFISTNPRYFADSFPLAIDIVDKMKYKKATKEEIEEYRKEQLKEIKLIKVLANIPGEDSSKLYKEMSDIFDEIDNATEKDINKINKKYNEIINEARNINRDSKEWNTARMILVNNTYYWNQISSYVNTRFNEFEDLEIETDFYKNSKLMDSQFSKEDKGYWASNEEMFARAFACYVKDKLKEIGIENNYLCGHADMAYCLKETEEKTLTVPAFPVGKERDEINKTFDKYFEEVKTKVFKKEIHKEKDINKENLIKNEKEKKIMENENQNVTQATDEELNAFYEQLENLENEGKNSGLRKEDFEKAVNDFTAKVMKNAWLKGLLDYDKYFKYNTYIPNIINKNLKALDSLKLTVIAKERGYKDDRWISGSLIKNEKSKLSLKDEKMKGVYVKVGSPYIELSDGSQSWLTGKEVAALKQEEIAKIKYDYRYECMYNGEQVNGISAFKEQFYKYEPKLVNNIVKCLDVSQMKDEGLVISALINAQKEAFKIFQKEKQNTKEDKTNNKELTQDEKEQMETLMGEENTSKSFDGVSAESENAIKNNIAKEDEKEAKENEKANDKNLTMMPEGVEDELPFN